MAYLIPTIFDKVQHICIFIAFAWLWVRAGRSVWWVLVAGAVYGMGIEVFQGVMPIKRSFDWYDGLADVVGTLIGVGLAQIPILQAADRG